MDDFEFLFSDLPWSFYFSIRWRKWQGRKEACENGGKSSSLATRLASEEAPSKLITAADGLCYVLLTFTSTVEREVGIDGGRVP